MGCNCNRKKTNKTNLPSKRTDIKLTSSSVLTTDERIRRSNICSKCPYISDKSNLVSLRTRCLKTNIAISIVISNKNLKCPKGRF